MSRFRRRPGTRVFYTNYQDARYLSQRAREDRARQLRGFSYWRQESVGALKRYFYRCLSTRSPAGFWTVTATQRDPNGGGGGGGGGGGTNGWSPALPVAGDSCRIEWRLWWKWNLSQSAYDDGAFGEGGYVELEPSPNFGQIYYGGNPPSSNVVAQTGQTVNIAGRFWGTTFAYALSDPIIYLPRGSLLFYGVETWATDFIYPNFPEFPLTFDPPDFALSRLDFQDAAIRQGFLPPPIISATCGINAHPGNPWPPVSDPDPDPDPDPNAPYPPGFGEDYIFDCDCPDIKKSVGALPLPRNFSELRNRSWVDSRAGAQGPCKHILRAAIPLGEYQLFRNIGMPDLTLVDPYVEWRDNLNYRRRQQADFRRAQRQRRRDWRDRLNSPEQVAYRRNRLAERLDFYQRQREFRDVENGTLVYYTDRTGRSLTPGQMLQALARANRAAGGASLEGQYDPATGRYESYLTGGYGRLGESVTVPGAFSTPW